jgi:ribosomal protein S18 acetylase RimI-like enzyme
MQNGKLSSFIRGASAHDAERLRSIARDAYGKYVARIGREPAPMFADFDAEIADNHVLVVEVAELVAGYMIAWPERDFYFIDNIAIDPAWQGQGLGRQLLHYAVLKAKQLRLPSIRLYTNVAMTENLTMYAHLGFTETHRAWEDGFHRVYLRLAVAQAGS